MKPRRVAIFQRDLHLGGVQKSLMNLLNAIDKDKYAIDLYLVDDTNFYSKNIPSHVTTVTMQALPMVVKLLPFSLVRRIFKSYIPSTEKEYDIAIDFDGYQHITAMCALAVKACTRVTWFHGNHRARLKTDFRYYILWHLQKAKYNFFDRAVVVSEGLVDFVEQDTPFRRNQIHIINNYVDTDEIISLSRQPVDVVLQKDAYHLVSVSRLAPEKGVDNTLRLFAEVLHERSDIDLCVVGGGRDESKLRVLAVDLGIQDSVRFIGPQQNPYAYMSLADGYISTPRSEGQGISTVEATCLGLDIFIPKELEKFTGVKTTTYVDLREALINARKSPKNINSLASYNSRVLSGFDKAMETRV